jgi:hypothetical protein
MKKDFVCDGCGSCPSKWIDKVLVGNNEMASGPLPPGWLRLYTRKAVYLFCVHCAKDFTEHHRSLN